MRKVIYPLFAVALIFTCSQAFSQSTVLMKAMDGSIKLDGGSTISKHVGEIEILSNSMGLDRCAKCGTANISSYNVMIQLSAATVSLKKLLLAGKMLTSIDVNYIKSGPTPFTYYKIHMENVAVESVQESASSEGPIFSVSFLAQKIAWLRIAQNDDGSPGKKMSYGWDLTTNGEWSYIFQ